ncbi:hypothetical protein [Streptomyces rimosus]|uniref:hypothetical protein n=1 Tax=Streptomyces rimosus TaxID=1927 RepID=UPI00311D7718
MIGRLDGRGWSDVSVDALGVAGVAQGVLPLDRCVTLLGIGDGTAAAMGVACVRSRLAVLGVRA